MSFDKRRRIAVAFEEETTFGGAMYRIVPILKENGHPGAALFILEEYIQMVYCWREVRNVELSPDQREHELVLDRMYDDQYEMWRNELAQEIAQKRHC
jgi:hypothetical protein